MLTTIRHRLLKKINESFNKYSKKDFTIYYFGYGANVDPEIFQKRILRFEILGLAKLEGYKFSFNTPCEYKLKGYGGVVLDPKHDVYGTLYKVHTDSMALLDILEWVPFNFYKRVSLTVIANSKTYLSEVYLPVFPCEGLFAPKSYKDIIIRGGKKIGFPQEYSSYIESLDDRAVFEIDHEFNLSNSTSKRWFPSRFYRWHDVLREKLSDLF